MSTSETWFMYYVRGGYDTRELMFNTYDEALTEFLNRIKHTKPLSGCEIEFISREFDGPTEIKIHIEHRVKLV